MTLRSSANSAWTKLPIRAVRLVLTHRDERVAVAIDWIGTPLGQHPLPTGPTDYGVGRQLK